MIALLFALRRESLCVRRALGRLTPLRAPCWAAQAGSIMLVETGMGAARVDAALDWLLPQRPERLIFAGFAGALAPELRVGDVVVASEVCAQAGTTYLPAPLALAAGVRRGRLLTTSCLVASVAEKQALAQEHAAIAVDMESARFAERCTTAGIGFACVRAISDEADTPLSPELADLLTGGVASPWRCARAIARRPRLLPEMLRLAQATRHAARTLAGALSAVVAGAA